MLLPFISLLNWENLKRYFREFTSMTGFFLILCRPTRLKTIRPRLTWLPKRLCCLTGVAVPEASLHRLQPQQNLLPTKQVLSTHDFLAFEGMWVTHFLKPELAFYLHELISARSSPNGTAPKPKTFPKWGGAEVCPRCEKPVFIAELMRGAGRAWHKSCFTCLVCNKRIDSSNMCERDSEIYCRGQ